MESTHRFFGVHALTSDEVVTVLLVARVLDFPRNAREYMEYQLKNIGSGKSWTLFLYADKTWDLKVKSI